MKIIFMGTPEFAVPSLEAIANSEIDVVAVVTVPDRKSGRGQKIQYSAVKEKALALDIPILQPEKLKAESFLKELQGFGADLFVVVAFRMLPKEVWQMPISGTINLHSSLLPDYRGAAPINWAVINGESETGVTTFFINEKIDTGEIIDQTKISIGKNESAGVLHDKMMNTGADLLLNTVLKISEGKISSKPQTTLTENPKEAPKIFKEDCKLDWNKSAKSIHNKIRGLSPYPTAYAEMIDNDGIKKKVKVYESLLTTEQSNEGAIKVENKNLYFGAKDYWIQINELQMEGKKRMNSQSLLNGYSLDGFKLV